MMNQEFNTIIKQIAKCQTCTLFLPNAPKPILSVTQQSKILIIGQAPGKKVYDSGTPWQDKSGETLRDWLGVNQSDFYNTDIFGILPLGFCFPGTSKKGGDLPPRPECAPQWHNTLIPLMDNVKLIILIGQYAQKYYLGKSAQRNLTETVKHAYSYLPKYFPLVHPSPLNFRWQGKNPWFKKQTLPVLKKTIKKIIT